MRLSSRSEFACLVIPTLCRSSVWTVLDRLRMAEGGEGFARTSLTTERWSLKLRAQRIVRCHLAAGAATRSLSGARYLVGAENGTSVFQEFLSLQLKLCPFLPFFVKHKSQWWHVCVLLPLSSAFSSPGWKKMSSRPTF